MRANIKHDVALLLTNQASRKGKSSAGLVKRRFPKIPFGQLLSAQNFPTPPKSLWKSLGKKAGIAKI